MEWWQDNLMPFVSFGVLLLSVILNEVGILPWQMISTKSIKQASPKWKWCPVVHVSGDESKVWCCKEWYCIGTWNVRFMNQGKLEGVKHGMARMNINSLGISELKWTGMGGFNSDDHYIYYWGQESLRRNGVAIIVNKRVQNVKRLNDLCLFPRKTTQHHGNPSSMPQPVTLKKLKLNGSMKTYKTFYKVLLQGPQKMSFSL